MRGRGQSDLSGSTATLSRGKTDNNNFRIAPDKARNRPAKPGHVSFFSKSKRPDTISLYQNRVNYSADNNYDLSADQFELLARLEETRNKFNKSNPTKKEFFSAKELAEEYPDLDGPLVSRKLRQLKDKGLIKEEKSNNGLSFALNEDLDRIYDNGYLHVPGHYFGINLRRAFPFSQEEKKEDQKLVFSNDSNVENPTVTSFSEKAFLVAIYKIEKALEKDKNAHVAEIIQTGKNPNGEGQRVMIIQTERVKTGKFKKETFLTFKEKSLYADSSLDVKEESYYSPVFRDGTCKPEDLFEAAKVLQNRRKVERGLI